MKRYLKPVIYLFVFCLTVLFSKCVNNNKNDTLQTTKRHIDNSIFIGKKISHFELLKPYCSSLSDSSKPVLPVVLNYVETHCSRCVKELKDWSLFLKENRIDNTNFCVLAVGDSNFYFDYNVRSKKYFDFSIYQDNDLSFIAKNDLEDIMIVKTIVLNKNGKIVYFGSPVLDQYKKKSFLKIVNKIFK